MIRSPIKNRRGAESDLKISWNLFDRSTLYEVSLLNYVRAGDFDVFGMFRLSQESVSGVTKSCLD